MGYPRKAPFAARATLHCAERPPKSGRSVLLTIRDALDVPILGSIYQGLADDREMERENVGERSGQNGHGAGPELWTLDKTSDEDGHVARSDGAILGNRECREKVLWNNCFSSLRTRTPPRIIMQQCK